MAEKELKNEDAGAFIMPVFMACTVVIGAVALRGFAGIMEKLNAKYDGHGR